MQLIKEFLMKSIIVKTLVLAICLSQALLGLELTEEQQNYKKIFLLPINWTEGAQDSLEVSIPEGYRCLQPTSMWVTSSLFEFIPVNEEADNWSEIITIERLVGRKIKASDLSQGM